jgi:hypothetical protein
MIRQRRTVSVRGHEWCRIRRFSIRGIGLFGVFSASIQVVTSALGFIIMWKNYTLNLVYELNLILKITIFYIFVFDFIYIDLYLIYIDRFAFKIVI